MEDAILAGGLRIGNKERLTLIAGCCVLESFDETISLCASLKEIAREANLPFVFKASYDKANRLSHTSYRGPGLTEGLGILGEVKRRLEVPILTDVHTPDDVAKVAKIADILQQPALLCRQTDLTVALARSGRAVNLKKGQFMGPDTFVNIIDKARAAGGSVMVTERGTFFGYSDLVVDMRSLHILKKHAPVVYDASHSVQAPGGLGTCSGGNPEMIEPLSLAAVSLGIAGLYVEVHPDPTQARCDASSSLDLDTLAALVRKVGELDETAKRWSR